MNATAYLGGRTNVRIPEPTHGDYRQQRGKSALAESLAASIHVPVIDLDLLNWEGSSARIRWGRRRGSHAAAAKFSSLLP
jgi:hypothetical protein